MISTTLQILKFFFFRVPQFDGVELTRTVDKLEYTRISGVDNVITGETKPLCDTKFWDEVYLDLNDD